MNEDLRHLRHAIRAEIYSIDEKVKGLETLKTSLKSLGLQMDKVINGDD